MRFLRSLILLMVAGTCAGVFWFVRSLPVFRFYVTEGSDIRLLWMKPAVLRLGASVLFTNVILLLIWLL